MGEVKPQIWDDTEQVLREFRPLEDSVSALDSQSGRYFVANSDIWIVNTNHQAHCRAFLDLEGDLYVDGQLFMEQ